MRLLFAVFGMAGVLAACVSGQQSEVTAAPALAVTTVVETNELAQRDDEIVPPPVRTTTPTQQSSELVIDRLPEDHEHGGRSRVGSDIDMIVVHTIGGPACEGDTIGYANVRGGAVFWRDWFNEQNDRSIHYVVGRDGVIAAQRPELRTAGHVSYAGVVSRVNDRSIGIELVNNGDGVDAFPEIQLAAIEALIKDISSRYDIHPESIRTHAELDTRKMEACGRHPRRVDPGPLFPMARIRNAVGPPANIATIANDTNLSEEVQAFAVEISDALVGARYMEQNCVSTSVNGWDGYPLMRCQYEVSNSDRSTRKAAIVMLNPGPERLAGWIFSTCETVSRDTVFCRWGLFKHILSQSGGQFPVTGIVYEDIIPGDGEFETYAFRNGVTVRLSKLAHRSVEPLSEEQIAVSLDPDAGVERVFRFGRIASTTQEQVISLYGGGGILEGETWSDAVGRLYKEAWNAPENRLLTAWASNPTNLATLTEPENESPLLIKRNGILMPANYTEAELARPGRLCIRYNNYWCIKSSGWRGEVGQDDRNHAIFEGPEYGARAFFRVMRTYRFRHGLRSTYEIFNRYAPSDDCIGSLPRDPETGLCPNNAINPTYQYALSVAEALGVGVDDDINLFDDEERVDRGVAHRLARAVLKFEVGKRHDVTDELLDEGLRLADLQVAQASEP